MDRSTPNSEDLADTSRVPELDGVRGAAALGIVLWHYLPSIVVREIGSIYSYLDRLLSLCWMGVDLFFVLSGFLIGSILLREAGSPNYFSTFYARRATRILPLYFTMLGLLVVGAWWLRHGAPAQFRPLFENHLPWWSYPLLVQNFFMPGIDNFEPHLVGMTWSLTVEEQFYLIVPLLVWVMPRAHLTWLFACLFFGAPILRANLEAGASTYVLLPCRLHSLMAGALLALAWRKPNFRKWTARRRRLLELIWILNGIPALILMRSGAGLSILVIGPYHAFINTWLAAWVALMIALLLEGQSAFGAFFRWRPLRWMGLRAYGLYLLHPAMLWLAHGVLLRNEPRLYDAKTAAVTIVALALSLAAADAAYRWIEEPFLNLGKRFKYRDRLHDRGPILQPRTSA